MSVYIIKESRGRTREERGEGTISNTYTGLVKYRHAAVAVTQETPVYRYYSGLNNIISRGKRAETCAIQRARSVGSAEETLLPLSVPPRISSPTASFLLIVKYILR